MPPKTPSSAGVKKKVVRTVRKTRAATPKTLVPEPTTTEEEAPLPETAAVTEVPPSETAVTEAPAPETTSTYALPSETTPQDAVTVAPAFETGVTVAPPPEASTEIAVAETNEPPDTTPETIVLEPPEAPEAAPMVNEAVAKAPAKRTVTRVRKVKKKVPVKRGPKALEAAPKEEKGEEEATPAAVAAEEEEDKSPNPSTADLVPVEEQNPTSNQSFEPENPTFNQSFEPENPNSDAAAEEAPLVEEAAPEAGNHDAKDDGAGEDVLAMEEEAVAAPVGPGDEEMGISERRRRRKTEIFIGGLDRDAKEEDIRKVFGKAGEIVEVRLMMDGKSGKNKGYAFLRYATAVQAKQAVTDFVKVDLCGKLCGAAALEGNDTIFLGNIDKKWKKEDVMKLLQDIGIEKIDTVTVMTDPNNAEANRGFAFIELETNRDAQNAYKKLQKKDVFGKGRNIKVAWAEPLNDPDEEEMQKVKSVYAEGLPSSWNEEKVTECFKKFGEIERVVLARNIQSAKRKDFAFVNYTTREAALQCIESFDKEELVESGSKVNVKVSLAKPVQKGKQNKGGLKSGKKDYSREKPKAVQRDTKVHVTSSKGQSFKGVRSSGGGDNKSSTTRELLHVLREQASWQQGQTIYNRGPAIQDYTSVLHGGKRPFSSVGDSALYSDSRGYPRARLEGSYPVASSSSLSHGMAGTSLPYYQQSSVGYATGALNGAADPSRTLQARHGAAPYGSNLYSRY